MNTIWEVLLKEQEDRVQGIRFVPAKSPSPYLEILFEILNTKVPEEGQEIEVNPYHRFYGIFKDCLLPDLRGMGELMEVFFDPMIRYLGQLDLQSGLYKQRYYHRFLAADFEAGVLGPKNRERFLALSVRDREIIGNGIFKLYRTGVSVSLYEQAIRALYPGCYLYCSTEGDGLYLYLGEERTEENRNKTELASQCFLPVGDRVSIYWEQHFCILGEPVVSVIGRLVPVG